MNGATIDRDVLVQHVREALEHLYDYGSLQAQPLAALLQVGATGEAHGASLRRTLLDAIQVLKPLRPGSTRSGEWRRYRHLFLRYVEGVALDEIRRELGVSERQARRDHHNALLALADLLWERYDHLHCRDTGVGETEPGEEAGAGPAAALEAELAKLRAAPTGPTRLDEAIEGAFVTVSRLATSKGVQLCYTLPADLAPVTISRTILRQVLLTLLAYALEHSSGGQVSLSATATPTLAELRLLARPARDTATAHAAGQVPADDQRLALSRRLLELQGGSLSVVWAEGGEVTLSVTLPSARPLTVLAVDDNPDILRLFRRYLAGHPYRVIVAGNAEKALRLAQEACPDAITLDLMMPSQDGWEILQNLKHHCAARQIPVVVCSVLRERELALSLGAAEFLAKPITQQALLAALERCRATRPAHPDSPSRGASTHRRPAHQGE